MTSRQIAFCRAYFEYPVGAEAARRSGYSERTARQIAWKIRHRSRVTLDALYHAYITIHFPAWPFALDGRILSPQEAAAEHEEFFKTVKLPAWFIADWKAGRYKSDLMPQRSPL
jgi:hypothetical protein